MAFDSSDFEPLTTSTAPAPASTTGGNFNNFDFGPLSSLTSQTPTSGDTVSRFMQAGRVAPGHEGAAAVAGGAGMQGVKQGAMANLPSATGEAIKQTGQTYKDAYNKSVEALSNAFTGQQSGASAGLQLVGNFAKPTVDSLNNLLSAALNPVIKPLVDVAHGASDIATGKKLGSTEQKVNNATQQTTNLYDLWSQQHPEASKDLESLGNIGQLGMYASMIRPGADTGVKEGLTNTANAAKDTAGKVINAASDVTSTIKEAPGKLGTKIQNAATSIPKNVETELTRGKPNTMAARVQEYSTAAKQAMADSSKPTPMELAGQKAEGALKDMKDQITKLGQQKKALTTALGSTDATSAVKNAYTNLKSQLSDRLGVRINKDGDLVAAPGRLSTLPKGADTGLLKTTLGKFNDVMKNPTFQKVDDLIDSVQNELYKRTGVGAEPVNTQVQGILKQVTGGLNDSLKELGGSKYSELNSKLSDLMDTRNTLNKGLGTEANKGAALMKQLFSPNGTLAKNLFGDVKRLTGTDLVSESTIAKWAMENSGDVRQASLLKQVLGGEIQSKSGLVQSAIQKGVQALQNPEGKALEIIKKNIPNLKPEEATLIDNVMKHLKNINIGLTTQDVSGNVNPAWTPEAITQAKYMHEYQGAELPDFSKPPASDSFSGLGSQEQMNELKAQGAKPGSISDLADKAVAENPNMARPFNEAEIEKASQQGDIATVKKLIGQIPDSEPIKQTFIKNYLSSASYNAGVSANDLFSEGKTTSYPISRFVGKNADIKPVQTDISPEGIQNYMRLIGKGERPLVTIDSTPTGDTRIVDGHTRLQAYKQLGFQNIPVRDLSPKAPAGRTGIPFVDNQDTITKSQLTNFYNQANGTPQVKGDSTNKAHYQQTPIDLFKIFGLDLPPMGQLNYQKSDILADLRPNVPFLDTTYGKQLREKTFEAYPFTDYAKNLVSSAVLRDSPGVTVDNSHAEGQENPEKYFNIPTGRDMVNFDPNKTDNMDVRSTLAHEFLHVYFDKTGMVNQADAFNKAWESNRNKPSEGFPLDATFQPNKSAPNYSVTLNLMDYIDKNLKMNPLYKNIDSTDLANERFAYLGQYLGYLGKGQFPRVLRPFYDGIFKSF